jgi:hypothetical protein
MYLLLFIFGLRLGSVLRKQTHPAMCWPFPISYALLGSSKEDEISADARRRKTLPMYFLLSAKNFLLCPLLSLSRRVAFSKKLGHFPCFTIDRQKFVLASMRSILSHLLCLQYKTSPPPNITYRNRRSIYHSQWVIAWLCNDILANQ